MNRGRSTSKDQAASRPAILADVAREAGVDPSTASRVLRGMAARVAPETRERIEEAARRLAYHANATARALRLARTEAIGMVVPQLDNPVFSTTIGGAQRAAEEAGYALLIIHQEPGASTADLARRLDASRRVDGWLIAAADEDSALRDALRTLSVPYVVLNRQMQGVPFCAALDNAAAARMAVDHLIGLGHRRIGHLAGRLQGYNGTGRLRGYRQALEAAGLAPHPELVVEAGYTVGGGAEGMRRLLPMRPTAVFAATLIAAAGALRSLHEAGLHVPRDMSVIAMHDGAVAELVHPPLTTVRMPTSRMGQVATEALIALIEGRGAEELAILPPEELILRASTAPWAGKP
jgi:LacI family transcriptional regulator